MTIRTTGGPAFAREVDGDLDADRRLAGRIRNGDELAFEELVASHFGRVARITAKFFRRPEIAEEVNQDVFVKVLTSIGGYRAETPLSHWIGRVAVNACYDRLRRHKRRPETAVSQIVDEPSDFYDRLAARDGDGAGDFWAREDARLCAEELLELLEPAERLVLTLMVLDDLSTAEVAAATGWSKANVKVRAFRARGRLRKILEARERARRKEGDGDVRSKR